MTGSKEGSWKINGRRVEVRLHKFSLPLETSRVTALPDDLPAPFPLFERDSPTYRTGHDCNKETEDLCNYFSTILYLQWLVRVGVLHSTDTRGGGHLGTTHHLTRKLFHLLTPAPNSSQLQYDNEAVSTGGWIGYCTVRPTGRGKG